MTVQETARRQLRQKFPVRAQRADKGSKAAMIQLFCLECMGGSTRDALWCETRDCTLWSGWRRRVRLLTGERSPV